MTKDLEIAFDNTINSDSLTDLNYDLVEVAIDSEMTEGILKEIPIVKFIVALFKTGLAITERMFMKKVFRFLIQTKSISAEEKRKFTEKIEADPEYKERVSEALLVIIDQLNDMRKPEILGKLYCSCVKGKFDYKTFLGLANIIDKCYVPDLEALQDNVSNMRGFSSEKQDRLYALGLISSKGIDFQENPRLGKTRYKKPEYHLSKYGTILRYELFHPSQDYSQIVWSANT